MCNQFSDHHTKVLFRSLLKQYLVNGVFPFQFQRSPFPLNANVEIHFLRRIPGEPDNVITMYL